MHENREQREGKGFAPTVRATGSTEVDPVAAKLYELWSKTEQEHKEVRLLRERKLKLEQELRGVEGNLKQALSRYEYKLQALKHALDEHAGILTEQRQLVEGD